MASVTSICNRALQLLGANRIVSIDDNTPHAVECSIAYEPSRDFELRLHPWKFAKARAQLAADVDTPDFGPAYQYTLPADFLRLIENDPEDEYNSKDWVIEGGLLLTDDTAPLDIRYIKKITDVEAMDPMFREALSHRIAMNICERITQSNVKLQNIATMYKSVIDGARKVNALEQVPVEAVDADWITVRY